MYDNLELARPMLYALSLLTNNTIKDDDVDLSTLGKTFQSVFFKTNFDERRRLGFRMNDNIESTIGRWAFFPDIANQIGAEKAFGRIMGGRLTKNGEGNKYFLSSNVNTSMREITNSTPYLVHMKYNIKSQFYFEPSEQIICNDYLNTYCIYLKNRKECKGYINSFNPNEIHIQTSMGSRHSILFENRHKEILEVNDDVDLLTFGFFSKRQ